MRPSKAKKIHATEQKDVHQMVLGTNLDSSARPEGGMWSWRLVLEATCNQVLEER